MDWHRQALELLKETSRTFYIPISQLPSGLQESVTSAYLCMRAIDEIEDHHQLPNPDKAKILRSISLILQTGSEHRPLNDFSSAFQGYEDILPEVSLRVGEWAMLAPNTIAPRIWDATAAMADRMAHWAEVNWNIQTESDLDSYTFSVAGAVGLLLSDLWAWYDGTQTNRSHAIGFGRGLQAVNIMRNHHEDLTRGVNFLPENWSMQDLDQYVRKNLTLADAYLQSLPQGPALDFCLIPLSLAYATLDVLASGKEKLSREDVMAVIQQLKNRQNLGQVKT
jgi:farnesyl-diphosphate farnesyltransferase